MAVLDVLKMGHFILQSPALSVTDFKDPSLPQTLQNMLDTMRAEEGVGIAAPQIGVAQRIIIFGYEKNRRYPDQPPVPHTVLINPSIEFIGEEKEDDWEGCLSVPGLRGLVSRYRKIRYSGFDAQGQAMSRTAEGFHARVVQHEVDHLNGILYPQRIKDLKYFGFEDALILR